MNFVQQKMEQFDFEDSLFTNSSSILSERVVLFLSLVIATFQHLIFQLHCVYLSASLSLHFSLYSLINNK